MGFYGNVSNAGKTNMVFDKIYSSRADMAANCEEDGVYAGRYVLIEYERKSPDDTIHTIYAPASSNKNLNQVYTNIDCTTLLEKPEVGAIYRLIRVDNGTITLNEYYFYDGQSYNSLAEFDGKTPSSQLPGGASPEANYILNFNRDKLLYGNIRGYDSTVWMKSFYTSGKEIGKGYYINIAELNSVVPSFGITVDAPTTVPTGPYFDEDSTNIYYDLHLQPSWGLRVKKKAADDKSDVKINYQTWDDVQGKITEELNIDGAIYFNKDGFNPKKVSKDTTTDSITITPSPSGKLYNGKVENDVYDLSIQLPSIGNIMSDVWDIVHGPSRKDSKVEKDKSGNRIYSLCGLLKSFKDIKDGDIPYKQEEDGSFVGMTPQGDRTWIDASVKSEGEGDDLEHNFKIIHKTKFSDSNNPSNKALSPVSLSIGGSASIPYPKFDNAGHISGSTSFQLNLSDTLSKYALDSTKTGKITKEDTLTSAFNKLENADCMTITSDDIEAWDALKQAACMNITSDQITAWDKPADWEAQEGSTAIINKPTNLITTDYSFTYGDTTKNLQDIITDLLNRISTLEAANTTPPVTE